MQVLEEMKVALGVAGMEHVGNISADVDGSSGIESDESTWPGCLRHECQMGQLVTMSMLHYCNSTNGYNQITRFCTKCELECLY